MTATGRPAGPGQAGDLRPLADMRIVELSNGLAPARGLVGYGTAYAGKLFADAGAEVWLVEPDDGDPLRRWSAAAGGTGAIPGGPADGALFRFLAASKRSLVGDLGSGPVEDLIGGADLVIESLPPRIVDDAGLVGRPGLVVLSISPFGRGSWQERPATEFTVQAECGSIAARTYPEGALQAGGRIAEWAAGVFGAASSLAAIRHARRTGRGAQIDVSMAEVMCICTNLFVDLMMSMAGRPPLGSVGASAEFPAIERTADGWVGFNTNSAQMFQDFLVLVERADLAGDPMLRSDPVKRADLERSTHEWCLARTTHEIVEEAALLRIPCVPVGSGTNLPEQPHLVARQTFASGPEGDFTCPRPPYRLNGSRLPQPGPAPAVGADAGALVARNRPASGVATDDGSMPAAGLKVLDMTCWWAGPGATQLLAALGADVIHVEAIQRMDGMRPAAALLFSDREQWWEYSSFFLSINVNKRGITLNLDDPAGIDLVHRLIGWADVVIENYTPRVMERFGLDAAGIHEINPAAVVVRMPAFGLDGPWRDRVGFAQTMEAMCGMATVTGVADGPPRLPRGPCDPGGAMHGAFALQVALTMREASGAGQVVEAALLESGLNLAAEPVVEASAYGVELTRDGNRSPGAAPQGLFACRGEDSWLAISVMTDEHWSGLVDALGAPDWASDPALSSLPGRIGAQDVLEKELAAWAAGQELEAAVDLLVSHGVPAAARYDFRAVAFHPLFVERRFFEEPEHPVVGRHPVFGMPFRYSGIDRWIRSAAPSLGQHNEEVLATVLGLDAEEISDLAARQVIGNRPLGV